MLLALDTATSALTVAVHDGRVLFCRSEIRANRHAEQLAPLISAVLAEAGVAVADVDTIAVGVGPGPFTGLRVGLTTAKVLGLTLSARVVGVCSLDALAQGVVGSGVLGGEPSGRLPDFVVATDARRREVYWAGYQVQDGWVRRVEGPAVGPADGVPRAGRPVFGRGVELYPQSLGPSSVSQDSPVPPDSPDSPVSRVSQVSTGGPLDVDAGVLAELVAAGRAELLDPAPLYLRRPDAQQPGAPKRVTR